MNAPNNALVQFLQEFILRFSTKSPKFFQIIQIASAIFVAITGIPDFLHMFGITIPTLWNEHLNTAIAWSSRFSLLISLLTTQSKPTAIDVNGNVLKTTNDKKLPFTASQETKQINDSIPVVAKI